MVIFAVKPIHEFQYTITVELRTFKTKLFRVRIIYTFYFNSVRDKSAFFVSW